MRLFLTCLLCIACARSFATSSPAKVALGLDEVATANEWIFEGEMRDEGGKKAETKEKIESSASRAVWGMREASEGQAGIVIEGNVFSDVRGKCSRYCIRTVDQSNRLRALRLAWSFAEDGIEPRDLPLNSSLRLNISQHKLTNTGEPNVSKENCQIYLDLHCADRETESSSYNIERGSEENEARPEIVSNDVATNTRRIIKKDDLSGHAETSFNVDAGRNRILIEIRGDPSRAAFEIPLDGIGRAAVAMSLTRSKDSKGMRIETRNAPPGEWRMRLSGEKNSKYDFTVSIEAQGNDNAPEAQESMDDSENKKNYFEYTTRIQPKGHALMDDVEILENITHITANPPSNGRFKWNDTYNRRIPAQASRRSIENLGSEFNGRPLTAKEFPYHGNVSFRFPTIETLPSNTDKNTIHLKSYSAIPDVPSNETLWNHNERKIQQRSSIVSNEDVEVDVRKLPELSNDNAPVKMVDASIDRGLTFGYDDVLGRETMLIDVNKDTSLVATPGTIHRVVFDVANGCVLPVRYAFKARSSPLRVYSVQPLYTWIYPGQMSNVAVNVVVPSGISSDVVNTVTLSIEGTEIAEKSTYLYVRRMQSEITDDERPSIEYSFNNNCAGKQSKDRCAKSSWSADITIQDTGSGLKHVTSSPNNIYPRTAFQSGTKNAVTFYYTSTCCSTTVKVTAVDLYNNVNTRTIDVTAWDNLSEAEIAAVTVGVLLILLLIILIILIIIYCFKRNKSHNLPYTQRYGSRSAPRPERTSF